MAFRHFGKTRGVSLTGYGLIVGLVAVIALTATTGIGDQVTRLFGGVADDLTGSTQVLADPSPVASPDDGAPDLLGSTISMDTNVVLEDITLETLALFDDADTPLTATLAANGDGACITIVQFDAGIVRLSTAASPCTGSFQIVVQDSEGNATPFTTINVTVTNPPVQASCAGYHSYNPVLVSGVYSIDPDGPGGNAAFNAWCDMDSNGGGWTRCASILHQNHSTYGLNFLSTNYTGNTSLSVTQAGNMCGDLSFSQLFGEARLISSDSVMFQTGAVTALSSLFQNNNGGVRSVSGADVIATTTRSSHQTGYHIDLTCDDFDNGKTQGEVICITNGSNYQAAFGDINRSNGGHPLGINMCDPDTGCGNNTGIAIMLYGK